MHLIHRNRVDHFADFPRNISPLRSPFPSGARLSARILFVRLTVTVKAMIVSVLLSLIDKDNRNKPCPAGEGGPQRKKNANTWSDFLTRLRWMRCITRTLFHIFANAIGAELMTQLLFYMQKTKKKPRARRGEDYLIYSARSYLFRYL